MAKGRRRSRETPTGDRARSGRARTEAVPADAPLAEPVRVEPGESERAASGAIVAEPRPGYHIEARPVEDDGVRTVAVITVLWAIAFVVLALQVGDLETQGRGWWLWTCLAGVGLGLLGLEYTRKRRDAIESALEQARADADADVPDVDVDVPDVEDEPLPTHAVRPESVEGAQAPPERGRLAADTTTTRPIDTGHGEARPVRDAVTSRRPAPQPSTQPPARPFPDAEVDGARHIPSSSAGEGIVSGTTDPPSRPGPTRRRAAEVPAPPQAASPEPEPTTPTPPSMPMPTPPDRIGVAPPEAAAAPRPDAPLSELFGAPPVDAPGAPDDDEPLLDTTLGGGRRARRFDVSGDADTTDETGEITEGGGRQYRGRRARRSDSA